MSSKPGPRAALLFGAVLAAASAAPPALAQSTPVGAAQPGRLVIIGGGLNRTNESVYRAILDARHGSGPFCIFPTAGATPETAMQGPVENFERYAGSGTARGILVSEQQPETARDPAVAAQISQCSGFFFIGGQQSRIINAFRPNGESTPAYEALMRRWREGAVMSGSSAGAAIMSDPMIAGGDSPAAMRSGVRRGGAAVADDTSDTGDSPGRGVSITTGIGFFPAGLVDQHFLARGRVGRLLVAVLEMDEFNLGFGIDENTALVVAGDSAWTVGASGVVIIDAHDAQRTGRGATNVAVHLMGEGDSFNLATRRFIRAPAKAPLASAEAEVKAPDDFFARWSFLHLLHELGRSSQSELRAPIEGGEIVLRKTAGFAATSFGTEGVESTPFGLSVTGLQLELRR